MTTLQPELSTSGLSAAGIDQLVKLYTDALDRMAGIVANPVGRTQSSKDFRQSQAAMRARQIDQILGPLKVHTAAWTSMAVSQAAKDGIRRGEQQARDAGVVVDDRPLSGSFNLIDQGTVKQLVRDITGSLDDAAVSAADRSKHVLRQTAQLGLDESDINRILAGGVIDGRPTQTIRNLRESMRAVHGNQVVVNGRNFEVGYYASMVARTKTREASVTARHERLVSLDLDLVSIIGRVSKNFCTAYLGLVFSIGGKSDKYPALTELPSDGPPFHPNCSKSTRPFIPELASGKQLELSEPTADQRKMIDVDNTTEGQRRFQDLQVYAQQKSRYGTTAKMLFGPAGTRNSEVS